MAELEDFDDIEEEPIEGEIVPADQPGKRKGLAWTMLILGGIYLLNPAFGVDLLPDNLPILGNLDEVATVFLMLGAIRYLGIDLPDFLERWMKSPLGLPAPKNRDQDYE